MKHIMIFNIIIFILLYTKCNIIYIKNIKMKNIKSKAMFLLL